MPRLRCKGTHIIYTSLYLDLGRYDQFFGNHPHRAQNY